MNKRTWYLEMKVNFMASKGSGLCISGGGCYNCIEINGLILKIVVNPFVEIYWEVMN